MYARLTIMQVKLDRIDEAVRLYKKSVVPAAKKQKGFMGASLLSDRLSGKGVSITYWRNEKLALANEENLYYQEQLVKALDMFAGPPIKEGYEVNLRS